jgi:hypothetical protein
MGENPLSVTGFINGTQAPKDGAGMKDTFGLLGHVRFRQDRVARRRRGRQNNTFGMPGLAPYRKCHDETNGKADTSEDSHHAPRFLG